MAARQRKTDESFKDYRTSLKFEAAGAKQAEQGAMIFQSTYDSALGKHRKTAIANRMPPRKKERKGRVISYRAA
jgi:hypothetical protein